MANSGDEAWSPFLGEDKVQDSVRLDWCAAFTAVTTKNPTFLVDMFPPSGFYFYTCCLDILSIIIYKSNACCVRASNRIVSHRFSHLLLLLLLWQVKRIRYSVFMAGTCNRLRSTDQYMEPNQYGDQNVLKISTEVFAFVRSDLSN
ncbi:hypothetical protein F2Q70_00007815 [Brassica cretica]|uniref:Uncharacterized protein n=1 Tax=Brassica cretica TaxID=69181 RepID=A0A8S9MFX1_BRACR|nr:hypothetical protein F2Q70_00007815 [Brassica cretica]